jgi:hypothetical protein
MDKKTLVIFNLATDLQDYLLAHSHDWIEEFAKQFTVVRVYSTRVGQTSLPENVSLKALGGGNLIRRIRALIRLFMTLGFLVPNRKNVVVFHHMSSKTVGVLAWPMKLLGIPQGVWYSHPYGDWALKIGVKAVDVVFVPYRDAFPFPQLANHVVETGHGIRFPSFSISDVLERKRDVLKNIKRNGEIVVAVIGRVTPVKRIENCFKAIEILRPSIKNRISVRVVGPSDCEQNIVGLKECARSSNVKMEYLGPLIKDELWKEIFESTFVYNGTLLSIDKSALIAASLGTPLLTENIGLLKLVGMNDFGSAKLAGITITKQIEQILDLPSDGFEDLIESTYFASREQNELENTINTISFELKGIKTRL